MPLGFTLVIFTRFKTKDGNVAVATSTDDNTTTEEAFYKRAKTTWFCQSRKTNI